MTVINSTLLVGLGSPYGDDQLGWQIAKMIEQRYPKLLSVRCSQSPSAVLDWLDGVNRLWICDACRGTRGMGSCHVWNWPAREIAPVRFGGSHDADLASVLTLAELLGQLPRQVTIWAVEAPAAPLTAIALDAPLSAEANQAAHQVANLIGEALAGSL